MSARGESAAFDALPEAARALPIPRIAEVPVDADGRFWVKHYAPRTDSHLLGGWAGARGGRWTVIETDGEVVAQVDLPDGFIPLAIVFDSTMGPARS